ncbi:ectonucleotide pyrophosphatase phosphodiesterase family member 1 [Colletotrichum truncatum]|uniref:Ectonucleotide pyrophosphatase phosphodiesterase family member 1 n=1 Tax=Colletotrichum truncatum TaxID=5467 RepID=A0ACC3Z0N2_COLTU|nr:ectonucleotide pyrophosphatase phosphodiesterase family member 1 [Colletotrichum truncatum]KAF6800584.1 ectonucleotide pyrophosphatase phosphodiesterase family member 1 [Colletotrichum truncatum]
MPTRGFNTQSRGGRDTASLLAPSSYDDDASSLHSSRSDQETDSDDDQLQQRARNSRELRAADSMLFMEEDEVDKLITDTRKKKQDLQRRGSGLAVPNPMKLFSRSADDARPGSSNGSTEDLLSEKDKRHQRRTRRKQKKERLMEQAIHGEDGELMYEMEEGGMKEGSSTGESSEREDSDELDRQRLKMLDKSKLDKRRGWRRWLFIHSMIAIGFAILVLVAWKLSLNRKSAHKADFASNGTALFAPTTIIISLDGFRADFLQRGLTPRLNAFVKEGVSPKYMLPSFPSVTFPNHYTLATGLYPESHGIVGNTFWDPDMQAEFYYTDPARSLDAKWWNGEPFWATAERQGIRSAIHMWPGSEAHILGIEPTFLDRFNAKEALDNKVSRILEFLDKPGMEDKTAKVEDMRPQLIAAYVPNVDSDGHRYGPNSTEIRSTIQAADAMMDQLFLGLEQRNLTGIVNVIVVSDHGMATTDTTRVLQLEDLVDASKIEHTDGWPLYGLRPKNPDDLQGLYDGLAEKAKTNPNFEVYLRDVNMPERYHFSKNKRIAPLWIVPKTGWAIVKKEEMDVAKALKDGTVYNPRGLHGYDHEHPLMRAIFIARGPAFPHPPNSQIDAFQNINVYNILCDSVGLIPEPNNGTLRLPLSPIGTHADEDAPKELEDPVSAYTTSQLPASKIAVPTVASSVAQSATQAAEPDNTIQVDPPQSSSTSTAAPGEEDGDSNGSDDDAVEKGKEALKGLWDWLADKFGKIWGKIKGNKDDKDDKKSDDTEESD